MVAIFMLLSFELTTEIPTLAYPYRWGGGVHSINPLRARSPLPKRVSGDPSKHQGDRTMSKSIKSQPASRPPVDALQYEKLALSAFDLVDRQVGQLDTLITLTSTICRNPALTSDERKRRQTLLELLVDTMEQYQRDLEHDRELYQVIALDAKGVPQSRLTARHAANLLAEASQRAKESESIASASQRKSLSSESAVALMADATQQPATKPH
jgi:hypothetical protein